MTIRRPEPEPGWISRSESPKIARDRTGPKPTSRRPWKSSKAFAADESKLDYLAQVTVGRPGGDAEARQEMLVGLIRDDKPVKIHQLRDRFTSRSCSSLLRSRGETLKLRGFAVMALGFERLVLFITGMSNIRDVIPFPRTPKNAEF